MVPNLLLSRLCTEGNSRLCVSIRDYYCYRLQTHPAKFNPILHGARLFQQWGVYMFIKIEGCRLKWIRDHQTQIRVDLYQGLVGSIAVGEVWEEILNELLPSQTPQDRPDLVARVFRAKLETMKEMLFKKHILGVVVAHVYVVEFQKRGLPHTHFLLIMNREYKLVVPEQYDCIISVELPDKHKYLELYAMVVKHMMYGPCGKTSFEDQRTVDSVLCDSFREAAERLGLIEAENTLDESLTESTQFAMPASLRRLFATILVFRKLVEQMVLLDLRSMLQSMGKDIALFPLPDIDETYDTTRGEAREVTEESTIEVDSHDAALASSLNHEQRLAYDKILAVVDVDDGGVLFVDGPGGTGKTFLYTTLLAKVWGEGKIAVATATSGVAASIMPGGRTTHSRFTKQSGTAKILRMASLILWDEASMKKRQAVEALDNSMRDIMGRRHQPFGGKTVVFGGDFRQVLPVARKGSRGQIIDAILRSSYLLKGMRQLRLVTNMRAHNDPWFADYLLRVGNGTEETDEEGNIRLPQDICVPPTRDGVDLEKLIDHVFPALDHNMSDPNYMTSRAILSTKNENVDKINTRMIERFQGEEKIYHSFDSVEDDPHGYYAPEFLNNLTPNGLPPRALKLKINFPIILLRNIDPVNGLCNATRLVVWDFQRNTFDAEIVLGQHAGRRVFLPRIPLCPSDDDIFPFKFKRKQFPIRLSFAMTINKAQGQTIPVVGVYLPDPIFSHGQLYVALYRATAKRNIKILAIKDDDKGKGKGKEQSQNSKKRKRSEPLLTTMKNIVYKEVLST
uniref:ATP-dependent DNA helicase n=1 Tax=Hordeum vulgare subsp. vulgare TaxID=112509 RepID=A0A8I6WZN8_HORVV